MSLALGRPAAEVPFFRFPYGAKTPSELPFVQKRGNTTFFWNMDSEDWKIRNPHQLFLNVLQQLDHARRGIILFHDIHEQTVIVLPHLLQELRVRGFKTVVFVPQGSVKHRDLMRNPWLDIPLADYEAHMASPEVAQAQMIASALAELTQAQRPQSLAVIGCAGGNGFERIHRLQTTRVVGVDIIFLRIWRRRGAGSMTRSIGWS